MSVRFKGYSSSDDKYPESFLGLLLGAPLFSITSGNEDASISMVQPPSCLTFCFFLESIWLGAPFDAPFISDDLHFSIFLLMDLLRPLPCCDWACATASPLPLETCAGVHVPVPNIPPILDIRAKKLCPSKEKVLFNSYTIYTITYISKTSLPVILSFGSFCKKRGTSWVKYLFSVLDSNNSLSYWRALIFSYTWKGLCPGKALSKVIISYRTQPNEKRSACEKNFDIWYWILIKSPHLMTIIVAQENLRCSIWWST